MNKTLLCALTLTALLAGCSEKPANDKPGDSVNPPVSMRPAPAEATAVIAPEASAVPPASAVPEASAPAAYQ